MRALAARSVALLLALLTAAVPALADWPAGGKLVSIVDDSFNGVRWARFMDAPAGDLYMLSVGCGGNSNGYTLQRIGAGGDIATGWPATGYAIGEVSMSRSSTLMGFTVDDTGCVWRADYELTGSTLRAQAELVRPDVVQLPGFGSAWNANNGAGSGVGMSAVPAPGGSYVAYGSFVQRLTRSGAIVSGWPAAGAFGVYSQAPGLQTDGVGGVVVFGASALGSLPTAKRVDPTGALHAGWPAGGLVLASGADDANCDLANPNFLFPSGPGWFIAGWVTPNASPIQHVQLQRFSVDGTLDPAWPAQGILAVAPDTITGVTLIADGSGGVHALWYAHGRAFGTHLGSDGAALSAPAVDLAGLDPAFAAPRFFFDAIPNVVAGAAPAGGLLFAWDDFHTNPTPTYHVRWLNADYTPNPSEPAGGRLVVPTVRGRSVRAVHADGIGGAYLAWEASPADPTPPFPNLELWMTRLLPSSLVDAPPAHAPAKLALSAPRPNPARGAVALDVTLPDDSPARIELLDVAGRVVRTQSVQGAGPHAVSLADLASLSPGLYFARAVTRGATSTTRVVVSR